MAKVETIYWTRIDYEADPDTVRAIQDKAFACEVDVEVETFHGNVACSPYITAEGATKSAVEAWADKVERYIRRRKGARLFADTTGTKGISE